MAKLEMNIKSKKQTIKKCATLIFSIYLPNAQAESFYFTQADIQSAGISTESANKLLKNNSFQFGVRHIPIYINGNVANYEGNVFIDNGGQPCITKALMKEVGLKSDAASFDNNGCLEIDGKSSFKVTPDPKHQRIDISAPITVLSSNSEIFSKGGNAALLNYNLNAFNFMGRYGNTDSYTGFLMSGFNSDNWIFRNKSTINSYQGKNKFRSTQTYVQKTFDSLGKILKIGDIDSYDQFYGIYLRGAQWSPEQSITSRMVTSIEGFAAEDSQIEIYQLGQLVYAGQVRAGHYQVNAVPVLNNNSQYEVILTSSNGNKVKSVVTAAESIINQTVQRNSGFSIAIGEALNTRRDSESQPLVATASYLWAGPSLSFGGGALVHEKYFSIAANASHNFTTRNYLSLTQYLSKDRSTLRGDKNGSSSNVVLTNRLSQSITMSNSIIYRTKDYRGIEDIGSYSNFHYRLQQGNSLNINFSKFGTAGLTYSVSERTGKRENNYGLSWSTNIASAYLTTSIQKQNIQKGKNDLNETRFYAQLSIPLGNHQNLRSSYSSSENWRRLNTEYQKNNKHGLNYVLGYSKESNNNNSKDSMYVEASKTTRFSQLGGRLNFDKYYKSLSTYMRGGVVVDNNSISFTPYSIGDTFAIVNVGKHPDIEVQTPSGNVRTDSDGNAVVSNLNSFSNNIIQVSSETAPKNLDIVSGVKRIKPSRGTYEKLIFDTKEVKRTIVYAKDKFNKPLPYGALVTDGQNDAVVGFVDKDGMIFFNDMPSGKVKVGLGNNNSCLITMDNRGSLSNTGMFTTMHKTCE